jgi:hypothetical protein
VIDIRNAINVLRRGQPPKPLPGYTQKSINEAWQLLIYFLEQHLSRIAEMAGTDAEEEKID